MVERVERRASRSGGRSPAETASQRDPAPRASEASSSPRETAFVSLTAAGKDEQKMRTEGHKVVRHPSVSSVGGLPAIPCLCRNRKLIQA